MTWSTVSYRVPLPYFHINYLFRFAMLAASHLWQIYWVSTIRNYFLLTKRETCMVKLLVSFPMKLSISCFLERHQIYLPQFVHSYCSWRSKFTIDWQILNNECCRWWMKEWTPFLVDWLDQPPLTNPGVLLRVACPCSTGLLMSSRMQLCHRQACCPTIAALMSQTTSKNLQL